MSTNLCNVSPWPEKASTRSMLTKLTVSYDLCARTCVLISNLITVFKHPLIGTVAVSQ